MAPISRRPAWLWDPWADINKLPALAKAEFIPPIDVYEKDNDIIVETPVMGIEPEKIDVSVEGNNLILKGKSEKKSEVEEKNYFHKEVRYGSFYRTIGLPAKVKGDKAEATYKDGLLRITIPKAAEVKEKTVKIKVKGSQ